MSKRIIRMQAPQKAEKNIRIPIILGILALIFGITGFLAETLEWPGIFEWFKTSTSIQGVLHKIALFEHYLYKTFQIAQFEYDPDLHGTFFQNPFLFAARWLAPLALIWTAVIAYFRLRREESQLKKIKKWKSHTIV